MLLAHKTELRPTPEQVIYLDKACGSRRHCYNQLLEHFSQQEHNWSKSAAYQYYIKTIRPQFDWYSEVSSRVTRNAIDDLDNAFKHFFRRIKAGKKQVFPNSNVKMLKIHLLYEKKLSLMLMVVCYALKNQNQNAPEIAF